MARKSLPITQLPSGRYRLRYYDDDGNRRSATFDDFGQARTAYFREQADLSRGQWIDPADASTTFGEYAGLWLAAQSSAPGTIALIESNLRNHLLPVLGELPLSKIRTSLCQALVSGLRRRDGQPLAPSTVGQVVQHLRQILAAAVQDRMLAANPAAGVRLPRGRPAEVVIPTSDEVDVIMSAIDPRSRALVVVGAGLGLRQGEAFGLSLDRIDFLRRAVKVDRQLVRLAKGSALAAPKTARSYRAVPLPEAVAVELARHIEQFASDDPDGLIFQASLGGRIRRDGWNRRVWKPAVVAAGRPELGFHALRHYYASALIRAGLSASVVARRLGNSPQMVLETYSHLWRDDDDRTRDAIDNVFNRVVG
jgi:integrase